MGITHEFPYANFHDVNIDWILKVIKEFQENYTNIQAALDNAIQQITDMGEEEKQALREETNTLLERLQDECRVCVQNLDLFTKDFITEIRAEKNTAVNDVQYVADQNITTINGLGRLISSNIDSLLSEIPANLAGIIYKQVAISNILSGNTSISTSWFLGDYAGGHPPASPPLSTNVASTTMIIGGAGFVVDIDISATEDDNTILREIRWFTGYDEETGYYTGENVLSINGRYYRWEVPASCYGFSVSIYNNVNLFTTPVAVESDLTWVTAYSKVLDNLLKYNCYDVLTEIIENTNQTHNGVTYTWNNGVCTVTGNATNYSANIVLHSQRMPDSLIDSPAAYLYYDVSATNVLLRIIFKDANNTTLATQYYSKNSIIMIPEGAVVWTMALYVLINTSFSEPTIVSRIAITNTLTNSQLAEMVYNDPYSPGSIINQYSLKNRVTTNGVTYEYADGVWTVSGVATSYSIYNMQNSYIKLPSSTLERGTVYAIYDSDNSHVRMRLLFKHELADTGPRYVYITGDTLVQLASTDRYVKVQLFTDNGTDLTDPCTISKCDLLNAMPVMASDVLYRNVTFDSLKYHNYFLRLNNEYLYFRETKEVMADSNYSASVIPIKKGERVFLKTSAGSIGAKPYAKLTFDHNIDYVFTDSNYFEGYINFDYDGYLVVNVLNTYKPRFACYIFGKSIQENLRKAIFLNSLDDSENMISTYDPNNVCRVLNKGASWARMCNHWGIIGASFDSGEFNYSYPGASFTSEIEMYEYSCWTVFQKMNHIDDLYMYCNGGQNTKDWIRFHPGGPGSARWWAYTSDTEEEVSLWSGGMPYRSGIGIAGGCWWKMREDWENGIKKQIYVINLGSNDINLYYPHDDNWNTLENYDPNLYYTLGTLADIGSYDITRDVDTPPAGRESGPVPGIVNSYTAYLGAIIERVLSVEPDAIILLATIRNGFTDIPNRYNIWLQFNEMIRSFATLETIGGINCKNHIFILDNGKFGPNYNTYPQYSFWCHYHPNSLGYENLAWYWNTLIDECIQRNFTKFRQAMFIGTGKKFIS